MKPVQSGNGPAVPESCLGHCFVEGDAAAMSNGRRRRRTALGISLAIESAALALLLIVPLISSIARPTFSRETTFYPFISGVTRLPHTEHRHPNSTDPAANHARQPDWFHDGNAMTTPPVRTVEDDSNVYDVDAGERGDPIGIGMDSFRMKDPAPPPLDGNKSEPKRLVHVSEGVEQAHLILRIEPRYPPFALQARKEGTVILHAIISRDGSITALDVLSGPPLLVSAALDAVRQWRYTPTILNGVPVQVETTITVIFRLEH